MPRPGPSPTFLDTLPGGVQACHKNIRERHLRKAVSSAVLRSYNGHVVHH